MRWFQFPNSRITAIIQCLENRTVISTQLLLNASSGILEQQQVQVEHLHLLSHEIPPGIYPDMTEHGWEQDDWPQIWENLRLLTF